MKKNGNFLDLERMLFMKIIEFFKYIALGVLGIIILFLLFLLLSLGIGLVGKGMVSIDLGIREDFRMACESGAILYGDCISYGLASLVIIIPALILAAIIVLSLAALGKTVEEIYKKPKG